MCIIHPRFWAVPDHVKDTCMEFWEMKNVEFTCWLHVENISELIMYVFFVQNGMHGCPFRAPKGNMGKFMSVLVDHRSAWNSSGKFRPGWGWDSCVLGVPWSNSYKLWRIEGSLSNGLACSRHAVRNHSKNINPWWWTTEPQRQLSTYSSHITQVSDMRCFGICLLVSETICLFLGVRSHCLKVFGWSSVWQGTPTLRIHWANTGHGAEKLK